MPLETFFAVMVFALVAAGTPGPNNMMLLASGVNFGFRRTWSHMCGIAIGFVVLLLCIGFGLGALLSAFPALHTILQVIGVAYLLYLAWRIAMSRQMSSGEAKARPMTVLEAAAFQWVNPKGWMMATTAMAVYGQPDDPYLSVLLITLAFFLMTIPAVVTWAGFGTALRGFLSDPVRLKWFNIAMGVALALSAIPMLH